MAVGAQVRVGGGGTFDRDGLSFGGFDIFPEQNKKPAEVVISVWKDDADSVHFTLSLGGTFEFEGQTWRLDKINDRAPRWSATLTRVS